MRVCWFVDMLILCLGSRNKSIDLIGLTSFPFSEFHKATNLQVHASQLNLNLMRAWRYIPNWAWVGSTPVWHRTKVDRQVVEVSEEVWAGRVASRKKQIMIGKAL